MTQFLVFNFTGDPAFDFFFSLTASSGLLFFIGSVALQLIRDHR
jgi:hypothetical protein